MKKLLLALAIFTGVSAGFSSNNGDISKIINHQLKLPAELKQNKLDEKVNVKFKLNKAGEIELVDVSADNEEIKKYVKAKFTSLNLKSAALQSEIIYSININFKVL